jgi:hypothetical protein
MESSNVEQKLQKYLKQPAFFTLNLPSTNNAFIIK